MQRYLDLLKAIKEKGTHKPAARAGMPGSLSLFGYQFRHNLADGFPLLTTKKVFWKGVVVELLWFLRGDTNVKYLIDNGVNIWNQDAYNYYVKIASKYTGPDANGIYRSNLDDTLSMFTYEEFCKIIKDHSIEQLKSFWSSNSYVLGDCGYQYGKVWRDWEKYYDDPELGFLDNDKCAADSVISIDQIKNLIKGLKENPEGRRHIVTAIDPAHDTELALYWCHCLVQFNCRPLDRLDKIEWLENNEGHKWTEGDVPKYYLDCHLYQRSADVVLGVPFNIASYALLTHILAKICNMVPGDFVHSFGDVHIYDNHIDAVEEQLKREPTKLPELLFKDEFHYIVNSDYSQADDMTIISEMKPDWFTLENYNPQPAIKAELSTGM